MHFNAGSYGGSGEIPGKERRPKRGTGFSTPSNAETFGEHDRARVACSECPLPIAFSPSVFGVRGR